jgi:predicted kinase
MFHCDLANVADAESRCCRHVLLGVANIIFNAADVVFRCYRHVVLDVVLRRREKRHLMLDVARNTGGNMAAI